MNVLEVLPSGEVVAKLATPILLAQSVQGMYNQGSYLVYVNVAENRVLVSVTTGGNTVQTFKVEYNESTNALSSSSIHTANFDAASPQFGNLTFARVATGGAVLCLSSSPWGNYVQNMEVLRTYFFSANPTGATTVFERAHSGQTTGNTPHVYVPFTETSGMLTNGYRMQWFEGGVVNQSVGFANAANASYGSSVTADGVYLGDGYVGLLSVGSTDENGISATRYWRVVKFTDANFAEISPNTNANDSNRGSPILAPHRWFANDVILDLVAPDLIVMCCIGNVDRFALRTLWLPAV